MAESRTRVPENFHALYDAGAREARGLAARAPAADPGTRARLAEAVPDLAIDYDEVTQNPVRISSRRPAARLSAARADSPESAAVRFVGEQAQLWGLTDDDARTVEVVSVSRQGLPTVRMVQRVEGVEVFNSEVTAAVGADNQVVSVAGQLFRGASAAPASPAARAAHAAERAGAEGGGAEGGGAGKVLSAEEAIAKAASDLTGHEFTARDFKKSPASGGDGGRGGRRAGRAGAAGEAGAAGGAGAAAADDPYRFYDNTAKPAPAGRVGARGARGPARRGRAAAPPPRPAFERPVRVKDVLFPLGDGRFAPGYYMELWVKGFPAFSYVVDAVDEPDILFRKNLTSGASFKYLVHNTGDAVLRPEDGPAPGTPHATGIPDGFQAKTIKEKLVTVDSLLPNRPWLPPGATTTQGNNCIAYADLKAPDGFGAGDVMGKVTSAGTFGQPYDHAKPASEKGNLQNSLVGMFFHVNWLHDRWYEAGFDEASGNAQTNNFGLGGIGGDPILAEGNDFSGHDNANMSTPADGSSPRMQMFEFTNTSPRPSRTSNHEALITFHEMGHYITNRLVGNGLGLTNLQGGAMGEGWGDFFAICMTSKPADDFKKGVFAAGGWTDLTAGFQDNYYFSIRRYPYSADMAKCPLTFKHISSNVVLPVGPPRNPTSGGPNNEEHNAGEVWCAALWEVFVNLVVRHQHAEAERRMLRYVVGGLKLTPSRPTFLQARDGILTAAGSLDPADVPLIWKGFAKRGMGDKAVAPPSSSTSLAGVKESFTVP